MRVVGLRHCPAKIDFKTINRHHLPPFTGLLTCVLQEVQSDHWKQVRTLSERKFRS
jgi:hypothetical protein